MQTYETDPAISAQRLRELAGHADSLGGTRPKAAFDDDGAPALAKFTSEFDTRPVERVEVATLNLARAAGLNAAEARLELPPRAGSPSRSSGASTGEETAVGCSSPRSKVRGTMTGWSTRTSSGASV